MLKHNMGRCRRSVEWQNQWRWRKVSLYMVTLLVLLLVFSITGYI